MRRKKIKTLSIKQYSFIFHTHLHAIEKQIKTRADCCPALRRWSGGGPVGDDQDGAPAHQGAQRRCRTSFQNSSVFWPKAGFPSARQKKSGFVTASGSIRAANTPRWPDDFCHVPWNCPDVYEGSIERRKNLLHAFSWWTTILHWPR